ncbi:MAG: hypothetical protein H6825_08475 [Planctomycetes bacterium]|nr:hypothetical protein [Planctomycetota bacterium]
MSVALCLAIWFCGIADEGVAGNPLAWLAERPADELATARADELAWFAERVADLRHELLHAGVQPPAATTTDCAEMSARRTLFEARLGCEPTQLPGWTAVADAARDLLDTRWTAKVPEPWIVEYRVTLLDLLDETDGLEDMLRDAHATRRRSFCGNANEATEVAFLERLSMLAQRAGDLSRSLEFLDAAEPDRVLNSSHWNRAIGPAQAVRHGLLLLHAGRVDEAVGPLQDVVDFEPRTPWADVARRALVHEGRLVEPTFARLTRDPSARDFEVIVVAKHRFDEAYDFIVGDGELDLREFEALRVLGDVRARPLLERLLREGEMWRAIAALGVLADLPGGASDALPELLARVEREGADPVRLANALHRLHPDGPDWRRGETTGDYAQRWTLWLARQGDAPAR